MAESLLAIVLVTTSAKGANLVFRWPPSPVSSPRLCRPKPENQIFVSQLDNPWRASLYHQAQNKADIDAHDYGSDPEYRWQRPNSNGLTYDNDNVLMASKPYDYIFGYSVEFLATLLCPQRAMCHQKFELIVDDLAFIGHPVCADEVEGWSFKQENTKAGPRGRESREPKSASDIPDAHVDKRTKNSEKSPEKPSVSNSKCSWLQTFQLALVLDLPDPSSSASGNVSKYFQTIYEQIAFIFTAVLFQEQVLSNFVEDECDRLISLKESFSEKDERYEDFVAQALQASSIACAMKALYEAIKSRSIAYVTLNAIPLELQLPPHLDNLLHNEGEYDLDFVEGPDDEASQNWGNELSFGWKLPALAPWKSLLLLDGENELEDPFVSLRGPHINMEDRALAEGLVRFLETASITLSLADMSSLLDWDLESQVYPVVRWLVHHRRAKIVDIVNPGLKTIFSLPSKFAAPLSQLAAEFSMQFSHPVIPPLPCILAMISTSLANQTNNHFFASVVKTKEHIPMYHDVVLWMLKRDMLITLHLRVRIIATREIKARVWERRQARARKQKLASARQRRGLQSVPDMELDEFDDSDALTKTPSGIAWLSLSPKAARQASHRLSSVDSRKSGISELIIQEDDDELAYQDEAYDDFDGPGSDETELSISESEDQFAASMIDDPGRATPIQRRWLAAMSERKELHIAKRFELINQYFDGKRSDDEILFRAEISRRELREVLHAYEPYLQTFLHAS